MRHFLKFQIKYSELLIGALGFEPGLEHEHEREFEEDVSI